MANQKKICFVIAPIGEDGTEVRKRSDQILRHVIQPAALSCGYEALRADKIENPGLITTQVIQHIVNDPLVIADLTGRNPNVFYELAIRHAIRKPFVQIIQEGEELPFDVFAQRTIRVNLQDPDSIEKTKGEIINQIRSLEKSGSSVDSPISVAVELDILQHSNKPQDRQLLDVVSAISELRKTVISLEKKVAESANQVIREMPRQNSSSSINEIGEKLKEVRSSLLEEKITTPRSITEHLQSMSRQGSGSYEGMVNTRERLLDKLDSVLIGLEITNPEAAKSAIDNALNKTLPMGGFLDSQSPIGDLLNSIDWFKKANSKVTSDSNPILKKP